MYYTARAKTRSTPTDPRLSVQASGSRTGTTPSLTDELYGVLSPEQRSSETSLRNNTFQIITLYITDKGTTTENNSGLASVRENSDRAVARVP